MSQKSLILIVGLVVVVVGGFLFLKSQSGTQPATTVQDSSTAVTQNKQLEPQASADANAKKMAFADFIKQGGAYKCTVSQKVENTDTKATIYTKGDMVSGKYTMEMQGMTMDSSFIVRDGYSYSWSSMMPTKGFKMKIDTAAQPNATANADMSASYAFNASQVGDYNCEAWSGDDSVFALPQTVTFTDVKQ
jgi:hypothetical protein